MIRKYNKETSKRKKNNYKEIEFNPKSSFMIRQYFLLKYTHVYKNKRIFYYNCDDYLRFKANPLKFNVNNSDDYTLISKRSNKKSLEKSEEENEKEKKYFQEKFLFNKKNNCSKSETIKLDDIENALFNLLANY